MIDKYRRLQYKLAGLILNILSRGLCVCGRLDEYVAAEIKSLGEGFAFSIYASEKGPHIILCVKDGRFARLDSDAVSADVAIVFKDITGALPVLLGKKSVATAFAQHRMTVRGNIAKALALVRVINIVEAYLFPKAVVKKSMRRVPDRSASKLRIYIGLVAD